MTIEQIWVDADACPKVIKEILFRAANRQIAAHYSGRQSTDSSTEISIY